MSHFTHIKTQMVDKEYLIQALEAMNHSWEEGPVDIQDALKRRVTVQIRVPVGDLGYSIGFRKRGEQYEIVADWQALKDVEKETFQQSLLQGYAYHAARSKLEAQGFDLVGEEQEQGQEIRLVLRRVA